MALLSVKTKPPWAEPSSVLQVNHLSGGGWALCPLETISEATGGLPSSVGVGIETPKAPSTLELQNLTPSQDSAQVLESGALPLWCGLT